MEFDVLAQFIEDELSFMTSHYNKAYLRRRIASRMRRTEADSYADYLKLLREDDDEQTALLNALSINVTEFFRNPPVWDAIASLLGTLTREHRTVRVWSAATADGREAYSVAMLALDDPNVAADRVTVTGTDINEEALRAARAGVYESSRTVNIHEQLSYLPDYAAYVRRDGSRFEVREDVRARVSFERHDLINDPPKRGFELVLCRNLFIYIDPEYKVPVLRTVRDSLSPGGYLVVGKAESLAPAVKPSFEPVDEEHRVYRFAE